MTIARGDELVLDLVAGENGSKAKELLAEIAAGYPVAQLRRLLRSENDEAVKAGAFIAAELGERFLPLIHEVPRLLNHNVSWVKSDALDIVLVNASGGHGDIIAQAVMLIRDVESGVRWKALFFLARATDEQLSASLRHIPSAPVASLTAWLLGECRAGRQADIIGRLSSDDQLTRLFAVAGAARCGHRGRVDALTQASASNDHEVRTFARDELGLLTGFEDGGK